MLFASDGLRTQLNTCVSILQECLMVFVVSGQNKLDRGFFLGDSSGLRLVLVPSLVPSTVQTRRKITHVKRVCLFSMIFGIILLKNTSNYYDFIKLKCLTSSGCHSYCTVGRMFIAIGLYLH